MTPQYKLTHRRKYIQTHSYSFTCVYVIKCVYVCLLVTFSIIVLLTITRVNFCFNWPLKMIYIVLLLHIHMQITYTHIY